MTQDADLNTPDIDRITDAGRAQTVRFEAGSVRWVEHVAPWLPIGMLVVSAAVAILLRVRVGGGGLSALMWVAALLAVGFTAARWPGRALLALVFLVPAVPYFRFDTWLGKLLPFVIATATLVGVSLSPETSWSQLLRDRRRHLAAPVLGFTAILGVSVVLVLLQRSPFLATLTGLEWIGGYLAPDWATLQPQSTLPLLRAGGFLLGPIGGLALLGLMVTGRAETRWLISRETVVTAFLLASALNLGVACGQVFVPGFPLPTLREPVSGLFNNPIGLSLLMTLAAPVALAVSLRPTRRWLRVLAAVTVVLVVLMFVPIRQRSAHLGIVTAMVSMLAASGWLCARSDKRLFRQIIAAAVAVSVLLALGLVGAFARTTQWRATQAAISNAPLSAVWLGLDVRGETNRLAFHMIRDRPLGGYGVGGFESALPAYYERHGPAVRQYDDHSIMNHPLHMFVDLGVFGLAANLWLLGVFILPSLRRLFVRADLADHNVGVELTALGCSTGATAVFFLSIWTGEWMYNTPISVAAFVLLAVAAHPLESREGDGRKVAVGAILALPMAHAVTFVLGV